MLIRQISRISLVATLTFAVSNNLHADSSQAELELFEAASHGSIERIERALDNGASINAKNERYGASSLLIAVSEAKLDAVKFLLQKGAFVESKTDAGITALMAASQYSSGEMLESLIAAGAKVDNTDTNGLSAIHYAAKFSIPSAVATLIKHGANPNALDNKGWTPLHYAVHFWGKEAVASLMKLGADPTVRKYGLTPAAYAALRQQASMLDVLEQNGALDGHSYFVRQLLRKVAVYGGQAVILTCMAAILPLSISTFRKKEAEALRMLPYQDLAPNHHLARSFQYADQQSSNIQSPE